MRRKITIRQRVVNGVRRLNAKVPNWTRRVSIRRLDMRDVDNCVLGQVFSKDTSRPMMPSGISGFSLGVIALGINSTSLVNSGFDLWPVYGSQDDEYEELQSAWIAAIRRERARRQTRRSTQ